MTTTVKIVLAGVLAVVLGAVAFATAYYFSSTRSTEIPPVSSGAGAPSRDDVVETYSSILDHPGRAGVPRW